MDTVDTMYEAICAGDEKTLAQCLERATINTVLQFEACIKESPLHLCLDVPNGKRFALIRRLIASGLVDATQCDSKGITVLVCAYEHCNCKLVKQLHRSCELEKQLPRSCELVKQLIILETEGVDGPTACYRLMKHRSLKLFQEYLSLRKETSEADIFQSIASALVKVNVKNMDLPDDLRCFLHWKLSDYAYQNLVGDWPGAKDPREWMGQMEIFFDCWSAIRKRYNTHMFDDIDDQLLHRLQVIHNHLYFLKNFPFLDHLPLTEVVFCLAIFISIFKKTNFHEAFRMLINKCLIMKFLGMIDRQLVLARGYIEEISRELKEVMEESQGSYPAESNSLPDLWEKVQLMGIGESDNWMKDKLKDFDRLRSATGDEKVAIESKLIKAIQTKIKSLNKSATPKVDTMKLVRDIRTRIPYMAHPENVANKLLADVKKGKSSDLVVAEVIATEVIDLKHLLRGKDRAIIRQVRKCYAKTKQLYSLMKIIDYWMPMYEPGELDSSVFIDSFKRILQVLGESVKNTQKSPNMPGKVITALNSIMSRKFSILNMLLREIFSHSMTLARTLISEKDERMAFEKVFQFSAPVRAMFYLLVTIAIEEACMTMFGIMHRCWSLEQLRSFLVYVGKLEKVAEQQQMCFQHVKNHFDKIKTLLDTIELRFEIMQEFVVIQRMFNEQYTLVRQLESFLVFHAEVGFCKVREAGFAGKDLHTVRGFLGVILTIRKPFKFFDDICELWKTIIKDLTLILPNDVRFEPFVESNVTSYLANYLGSIKAKEPEYLRHTQELAKKLGIAVDEDKEKVQKLHKMLERYYRNIFAVDLKRKILEDFFELKKSDKIPQDGKKAIIDQLIKEDQKRLQSLFNERRSRLREVLKQNKLNSVESLYDWTPSNRGIMAAIDYLQLELTEILTTVGYFGNSFYYVMHRIPVIQGKNYRNYLAHDGISYDLLSDFTMEIKVLNAYVIANTDIRLFDRRVKPLGEVMRFPSVEDTHQWVAEQDSLMSAFQSASQKFEDIYAAIRAGGELRSLFCCSPNHHYPSEYRPLTMLCDPFHKEPWITGLLNRYYNGFSWEIKKPRTVVERALIRRDFEQAFPRMLQLRDIEHDFKSILQLEGFFEWDEFIPRLRGTKLFKHIISDEFKYQALRQLIKSGNERSVREMLHFFTGDIQSDETMDPLDDAINCGVWSIVELLLARVSKPYGTALHNLIITHAPKEMFNTLLGKNNNRPQDFWDMINPTMVAKNEVMLAYLLEQQNLPQHVPGALDEFYELAAVNPGQHKILQQLLENYPPAKPNDLARFLYLAAKFKRWKSVRMLLDAGVSTSVFYENEGEAKTTFLLLVQNGQTGLLERVKAVDYVICGNTRTVHPLALAVRYGQDTKRMVDVLKHYGFDWFDCSTVLHNKLFCCITQSVEKTLSDLDLESDEEKLKRCSTVNDQEDYFSVAFSVLPRWKTIAYVEQVVSGETALLSALKNDPPIHSQRKAKESEDIKLSKKRLKYLSCLADVESKADEIYQLRASITRMEKQLKEKLEHFTKRRITDHQMFVKQQSCLEGSDLQAEFVNRLHNRKESRLNDVKKRSENYFQYLEKGVLESILFQKQRLKQLLCSEYTTTKKQEIDQLKASLRKLERCEAEQRYDLVSTLLDRSQKSRMIEGLGVLSEIVFEKASKIVRLDKEDENETLYVHNCCNDMINRMVAKWHCDFWREMTVNLGVSVTFRVLCFADEKNEFPPNFDGAYKLSATSSLLDTFIKLRDICREMFPSYVAICAHADTTEAMVYYWQIEELSCAFDVRPSGTTFDLANIINSRGFRGQTALHYCLAYPSATKPEEFVFQHRLAKLLLDHGANPLLADDFNEIALSWTLAQPSDPAIAHDAIEACLRGELRNEQGKTIQELEPPIRKSLIDSAKLNGRRDIAEQLSGLFVNVGVSGK